MLLKHHVCLSPDAVWVDGEPLAVAAQGVELLHEIYRQRVKDYPKFFKMDLLGKLGFVASELLLQREGQPRFVPREDRSILLANRSASIVADSRYQETIQHADRFYPSPALFVYTLPNIVTGEIAIRNRYYGETSFVVLEKFDAGQLAMQALMAFQDPCCQSQLVGWTECADEAHWQAVLLLVEREGGADASALAACLERLHRMVVERW